VARSASRVPLTDWPCSIVDLELAISLHGVRTVREGLRVISLAADGLREGTERRLPAPQAVENVPEIEPWAPAEFLPSTPIHIDAIDPRQHAPTAIAITHPGGPGRDSERRPAHPSGAARDAAARTGW